MVQLTSDLAAFGEPMRPVDEAGNHIASTLTLTVADLVTVPFVHADGRVLVHNLVASIAAPASFRPR
jgi:molybdopterin molybdotransferase